MSQSIVIGGPHHPCLLLSLALDVSPNKLSICPAACPGHIKYIRSGAHPLPLQSTSMGHFPPLPVHLPHVQPRSTPRPGLQPGQSQVLMPPSVLSTIHTTVTSLSPLPARVPPLKWGSCLQGLWFFLSAMLLHGSTGGACHNSDLATHPASPCLLILYPMCPQSSVDMISRELSLNNMQVKHWTWTV